ncbi:MAG: pyridoxal phosphate-dependent decarboxylase family protein [Bacteroidota bacterium]
MNVSPFSLDSRSRADAFTLLQELSENYLEEMHSLPVASPAVPFSNTFDLSHGTDPITVIQTIVQNLRSDQTHVGSSRYFGLFQPASTMMSLFADAITSLFNSQLSSLSHCHYGIAVEQFLIREFGLRFGFSHDTCGVFTTGGAEANITAVLCSLYNRWPNLAKHGLRGADLSPTFYLGENTHKTIVRAIRLCGIGMDCIRIVEDSGTSHGIDPEKLNRAIERDSMNGATPVGIFGTIGTTNGGEIDDIESLAAIAKEHSAWFHVDAAWAGAVCLSSRHRHLLTGIEKADSITFDAHKWLSVSQCAGMFITKRGDQLKAAFDVFADYMQREEGELADPYTYSLQWTRRFTGLKVYMSLAVAGWSAYEMLINHHVQLGDTLRTGLTSSGWEIVNSTPLPVVCFVPVSLSPTEADEVCERVAADARARGRVWLSTTHIRGRTALRACITSYFTTVDDVTILIEEINDSFTRVVN